MRSDPEQLDNLREIEAALVDALAENPPEQAVERLNSLLRDVKERIAEMRIYL